MDDYKKMLVLYEGNGKKMIDNAFGDNRFDVYADEIDSIHSRITRNYESLNDYLIELDFNLLFSSNEIDLISNGRYMIDGTLTGDYDEVDNFFENNSDLISTNPVRDRFIGGNLSPDYVSSNDSKYTREAEDYLKEEIRRQFVVNSLLIEDVNEIVNRFFKEYNNFFGG